VNNERLTGRQYKGAKIILQGDDVL